MQDDSGKATDELDIKLNDEDIKVDDEDVAVAIESKPVLDMRLNPDYDDGELVKELVEPEPMPLKIKYLVLAENGLFKRGNQYDKDTEVQLDIETASHFLTLGEIEVIQ